MIEDDNFSQAEAQWKERLLSLDTNIVESVEKDVATENAKEEKKKQD